MTLRAFRVGMRRDDGMSTVEAAVLMPAVILLTMLSVQVGILYHARVAAVAAAEEGGRTAASYAGTEVDGEEAAQYLLSNIASNELHDTVITVSRNDNTGMVTTVVKGRSLSLVPGWKPHISVTTKTPIERLTS